MPAQAGIQLVALDSGIRRNDDRELNFRAVNTRTMRTKTMRTKTMRTKTSLLTLSVLCSALFTVGAFAADTAGEPGRGSGEKNPLNNVYFGEQHLHTQNSPDGYCTARGCCSDHSGTCLVFAYLVHARPEAGQKG